jgi:hypothetical protein
MAIDTDFEVQADGDVRHVAGTAVYTALELHAWLQDLADNASASGDDLLSILSANPSKLDGPRDAAVASRLNLINGFNVDDTAAQFLRFGSVKQAGGDTLYSGLKSIGSIVAGSPVYVVQNGAKLTSYWSAGHIQILVKAKSAGSLIDSGLVRVYSRKYGQTYSDFQVDLSAGGENVAALSTSADSAVVLSEAAAAALSSKVTITVGDTSQDLGNGNGSKLYKGTIALSGGITVQEAYQYLQYITRDASTATINSLEGWRYRALDGSYTPNTAAPFGTFAGGKWFVAQGWFVSGVLAGESQAYQLIAHDGTTQAPPNQVSIAVGNLVAGDRVLVARDDGSGGIDLTEFTLDGVHSIGASAVVVNEAISTDHPTAGVIRVEGKRYAYTSYNAGTKTFALSGTLAEAHADNAPAFVPYLDLVAASDTESVAFTFGSSFTARVKVRQGSGGTPITPFETTLAVGAGGASVSTVRTPDV